MDLSQYVLEALRTDEEIVLERSVEPLRFAINSPAGSGFDAASAGDPKKNTARIFVEG